MEPVSDHLKQLPLKGSVPEETPPVISQEQPKANPEEVNPKDEEELRVLLGKLGDKNNARIKEEYDGQYSAYHIFKISKSKGSGESRVTTKEKILIAKFVLGGQDPDTKPEILIEAEKSQGGLGGRLGDKPEIVLTEAEKKARDTEIRASKWKNRRDIGGDDDE